MESVWEVFQAFEEPITYMGFCFTCTNICNKLRYKEKATVGQIKNFVEMESHEEKMDEMDKLEKYKNAKKLATEKAQQLKEQRDASEKAARLQGLPSPSRSVSSSQAVTPQPQQQSAYVVPAKPPTPALAVEQATSRGMQLGKKQPGQAQSNTFLDQVAKEGLDGTVAVKLIVKDKSFVSALEPAAQVNEPAQKATSAPKPTTPLDRQFS